MGRRAGGVEMWNGMVSNTHLVDVKQKDIPGERDPSSTLDHAAQGSMPGK